MNMRDLHCFHIIVKEKSITSAARSLYMSPQGLSKLLKNMENELGCTLLIRSKSGVQLTEEGQLFYEKTQGMLRDYRELQREIKLIQGEKPANIELLSAYGILRFVTPDCINDFKERHPEIHLSYREYPDLEVERKFEAEEGTIAFSQAPVDETKYDCETLFKFPLKLMVHKDHPLAKRDSVTIRDLKDQPLYLLSSEFKLHHTIVNRCREAGFEPNILFESSGFSLCHKMCRENKGITVTVDFVSEDLSGGDLTGGNLVLIPFSDGVYSWEAVMLTRKNVRLSTSTRLFRDHIRNWVSAIESNDYIR